MSFAKRHKFQHGLGIARACEFNTLSRHASHEHGIHFFREVHHLVTSGYNPWQSSPPVFANVGREFLEFASGLMRHEASPKTMKKLKIFLEQVIQRMTNPEFDTAIEAWIISMNRWT